LLIYVGNNVLKINLFMPDYHSQVLIKQPSVTVKLL
jgi:hypothetical protein